MGVYIVGMMKKEINEKMILKWRKFFIIGGKKFIFKRFLVVVIFRLYIDFF